MKPRLLANENFPISSVLFLRERGYDVAGITDLSGQRPDPEVLALAASEGRWIVTFDRDYGELIFARGLTAPAAVFLFRLRSYRPDDPGRLLAAPLESGTDFEGQFVLVEDAGFRKRPLPEPKGARG